MNAKHMLKMCLGKKAYKTPDFAKNIAKICSEKYGKPYYVYKCPLCFKYHLTTHKHEGAYYE